MIEPTQEEIHSTVSSLFDISYTEISLTKMKFRFRNDDFKEKFVELDGKIKLVNQKLDLVIKNHLHHMKKDIDRILYGLGAVGILVLGQLLYILSN